MPRQLERLYVKAWVFCYLQSVCRKLSTHTKDLDGQNIRGGRLKPRDLFSQESSFSWYLKHQIRNLQQNITTLHIIKQKKKCWYALPAVYTGEEDSLAFICRSHLSGVVNHPLFIAARAASVNLWCAAIPDNMINILKLLPSHKGVSQQQRVSSYHRTLQFRVLTILQRHWQLLHRVEDDCRADL